MNQDLQTVLDALEHGKNTSGITGQYDEAITIVKQMMQAEPVALAKKLRDTASKGVSAWGDLQLEAANALESEMALSAMRKGLVDGLLAKVKSLEARALYAAPQAVPAETKMVTPYISQEHFNRVFPAVPAGKPHCKECAKWAKEQADNREWIDGVAKGRRIVEQLAAAPAVKIKTELGDSNETSKT